MKHWYRVLALMLLLGLNSLAVLAQVVPPSSANEIVSRDVVKAQEAVNKVLVDAGILFKEGLHSYLEHDRVLARKKFDQSVEVFLSATLNIQKEQRLQGCYNQLIETIYRIEFPAAKQTPQIRNLSLTCNWEIDSDVADKVAPPEKNTPIKTVDPARIGFNAQEFEPSPLDELSKLELTTEEQQIDNNPVAKQQYQYIQYMVSNKSLGFSFEIHPMIQEFINYHRGRGHTMMEIGLFRSGMFMRMARRIFNEEGVPENVAWLGQTESAWKSGTEGGLWHLLPKQAARFGLQRTSYVDERNSFDEATRASARYLKFLADRYHGNWELAMAAYNSGQGNVDRAVRRAGAENFWLAFPYLSPETRNYVPNILATILIANNPNQYGFGHIRPADPITYDRIRIPASTDLSLIAKVTETTIAQLRYLNPHLRTNKTPPVAYIVNIPAGKAADVVTLFRSRRTSQVNTTKMASAGETWQMISSRTGVTVVDLIAANPGMVTPHGKVFVPSSRGTSMQYAGPNYESVIGPKPAQLKDGKVAAVMTYFNETLHDPYSMKFVRWSAVTEAISGGSLYWAVTVKYRAKNTLGAYVLTEMTFYIRHDRVMATSGPPSPVSKDSRPANANAPTVVSNIKVVKAKAGDTVEKVAGRYNASAIKVAKFNGLLPNSVLGAGREIKIPF